MKTLIPLQGLRQGAVRVAGHADKFQTLVRPEEEARRTRVIDRAAEGNNRRFVEVADQEVILGRNRRGYAARP